MPSLGIERYHYKGEKKDLQNLLDTITNIAKMINKSDFWKLGRITSEHHKKKYSIKTGKDINKTGDIEWKVLLNYLNGEDFIAKCKLTDKDEIKVYLRVKPVRLIIRHIRNTDDYEKGSKYYREYYFVPITLKETMKLERFNYDNIYVYNEAKRRINDLTEQQKENFKKKSL